MSDIAVPGAPDRWRVRLVLLGLLAALTVPLALNPLPFTADGRNHILRTLLLERALAGGDWFARYFPELVYGYGAPLLSYYAPLTYYAIALINGLGLGLSYAFQAVLALSLAFGGFGAATWAGAWYGRRARLIAGVLWAAAPYVLYNVYTRGAGPEVFGLAWLPWLAWSLSESLHHGSLRSRLILGGSAAGLMLTHNLTALLGFALVTCIGAVELTIAWRLGEKRGLARRLLWTAVAGGLGLAASAFFWVPALLETRYVQMSAATGPAGYDFRDNFLRAVTLLTGAFTYDPHRVLTPVPPTLGWGAIAFAGLGVLSLLGRAIRTDPSPAGRALRMRTTLLVVLALGCIGMTLSISEPVWTALPMAQLIQFPYRWLGPSALFLAVLGGHGAAWAQERLLTWRPLKRATAWLPLAFAAILIVLAWPWTFAKPDPTLPVSPQIEELYNAEVDLGTIGLTSTGEFLPLGAARPTPDPDWAGAVYAGTADRVDRPGLAADAEVTVIAQGHTSATLGIASPSGTTLRFRWLYWPGWQATLDGAPLPVTAAAGTGWVETQVPAGAHEIAVWLGLTPLRAAASVVSDLAMVSGLALIIAAWRRSVAWRAPASPEAQPWLASRLMIVVAALLAVVRIGLSLTASPFESTRYDGQRIRDVGKPLRVVFGDELILLGYDPPGVLTADTKSTLTSYWALAAPTSRDLSFSFQLWDDLGHIVGQGDRQSPGGWPTRRWFPGEYAVDTLTLNLDPTTSPGRYRLMVTVYTSDAGGGSTVLGRVDDGPRESYVPVGEVEVARGASPPAPQDVPGAEWITFREGPFSAVAAAGLPDRAQAGDFVDLNLFWQMRSPLGDIRPRLILRDAIGTQHDLGLARLSAPGFAESDWRPNDLWRLTTPVIVPPDAAPGRGAWVVRIGGESITLGAVTISVPERNNAVPTDLLGSPVVFAQVADLAGYRLSGNFVPGGELTIDLVWRSSAVTTQSLKVFVHLIGADGFPAAQSDSVPQGGRRPTTGWLPPEVIDDRHVIALPVGLAPGPYVLTVGLYDPLTGARVTVETADTLPSGQSADRTELQVVEIMAR